MTECPICGNVLDERLLADKGLDKAHLDKIGEKVRSRSLEVIVDLGEIALKYLHPERLGVEFQVHEALGALSKRSLEIVEKQRDFVQKLGEDSRADKKEILEQHQQELLKVNTDIRDAQVKYSDAMSQVNAGLSKIRDRIAGTGIGGPGEMITIADLKRVFIGDSFTHAKAASGGADIVADVRDGTVTAGKIVVSVKYQDKWKDEFVVQLERNLKEEKTEFGILVSRVFPADALSDKAYLTNEGWAIVKPEYVAIAYLGLREAVVHLHRARALIDEEEDRMRARERVTLAIKEWLSGANFLKAVGDLDLAVNASNETVLLVQQWQNYADERSEKVQKMQQRLRGYLVACSGLLTDLQGKLGKTVPLDSVPGSAEQLS